MSRSGSLSAGSSVEVAGRAWAPNTPYKAGDVVVQGGMLYRALADFTSAASFTASNWATLGTASVVAGQYPVPPLDSISASLKPVGGLLGIADKRYSAFPSVTRITSRRLFTTWREADLHAPARGDIMGRILDVKAATWTDPFLLVSDATFDLRDSHITLLSDNRVLLSAYTESAASSGHQLHGVWFWILTVNADNTVTASAPIKPAQDTFDGWISSAAPAVEIAGTVYQPIYGRRLGAMTDEAGFESGYISCPLANVATASAWSAETIVFPWSAGVSMGEASLTVAGNGDWVMLARRNATKQIYKSIRTAGVGAWSAPAVAFAGDGAPRCRKTSTNRLVCLTRDAVSSKAVVAESIDNAANWTTPASIDDRTSASPMEYGAIEEIDGLLLAIWGVEWSSTDANITARWLREGSSGAALGKVLPIRANLTTWTNMLAGDQVIAGQGDAGSSALGDLTQASECRLMTYVGAVGAAGAQMRLQYSADNGGTFTDIAGATVSLATVGPKASAWVTLPNPAKVATGVLRVMGSGGDGVADPQIGATQVELR
jgi:hypothetical protein